MCTACFTTVTLIMLQKMELAEVHSELDGLSLRMLELIQELVDAKLKLEETMK